MAGSAPNFNHRYIVWDFYFTYLSRSQRSKLKISLLALLFYPCILLVLLQSERHWLPIQPGYSTLNSVDIRFLFRVYYACYCVALLLRELHVHYMYYEQVFDRGVGQHGRYTQLRLGRRRGVQKRTGGSSSGDLNGSPVWFGSNESEVPGPQISLPVFLKLSEIHFELSCLGNLFPRKQLRSRDILLHIF
jgi:hypothetical protein